MCPGPFALWIIKWGSEYKTSLMSRFYGGYIFQNPAEDIRSTKWGAGYELAGSGSLLNPRRPESAPRDGGSVLARNPGSFAESTHRRSDAEVHVGPPREITAARG